MSLITLIFYDSLVEKTNCWNAAVFQSCFSSSLQPSQLLTAKGNCLQYCHWRENHPQQIFAINHLFTICDEPFSILLNKIFFFIQMFTLLRKHSSPDYFTWSISFPFILDLTRYDGASDIADAQAIANISLYYASCWRAQCSCF